MSIVVEEADESLFWIEILIESEIIQKPEVSLLINEVEEIIKVMSKARKTVSNNTNKTTEFTKALD